jgi:TrmH family RNA methyltransferase
MELPFQPLSSRESSTYKQLRSLRQPRRAHAAGLILIEGFRQVEEALDSGLKPQWLLATEAGLRNERWPAIREKALNSYRVEPFSCLRLTDSLFAGLTATTSPQGLAMLAPTPLLADPVAPPPEGGLFLVLEGIQDPGNLGTLIRTADAFAFSGVILAGAACDPFGEKALRAAMGSTFHLPLYAFPSIREARDWLARARIPLIAAALSGEVLRRETDLRPPAALAIGNEGAGLSAEALALADRIIRIDLPGRAESLNAAAAAAILCHWLALNRGTL